MPADWLHFDPIQTVLVSVAAIWAWFKIRADSEWHTEWIKRHSDECNDRDERTTKILIELQTSNAHLVTLTEGHNDRINRIEHQMDRAR